MKSRVLLAVLVLVAVVFTAANCSPKAKPAEQVPASGEAKKTDVPPTTAPPAAKQPTATPQPAPTAKPESTQSDLLLSDLGTLDQLDSYRIRHVMSWDETDGESGSMEMLTEFVREPAAQRLVMKGTDDGQDWQRETISIGDATYVKMGDKWMSTDQEELAFAGFFWTPEAFLSESKGKYVGQEKVSGLNAKHYHYETSDFAVAASLSLIKQAEADVWVSTEYNLYIKVVIRVVGVDADGVAATFVAESDLTDINEPITIEAPEGVARPELPEDIPMMDGAFDITTISGTTSFSVPASEDQVVEFYKTQMVANDWKMEEVVVPTMMEFTKDTRDVTVMISSIEDGNTWVSVWWGE